MIKKDSVYAVYSERSKILNYLMRIHIKKRIGCKRKCIYKS